MEPEILSRLPVPAYRYYESVSSTNDLALAWAASGAPDGALIIADTQTAGRGRLSRRWITPPDSALAISLVLRPTEQEMEKPALFSPLGGLALSIALESRYKLQPTIKWPNDVLLNNRKTAGILAESTWQDGKPLAIVLGIGVNVGLTSVPPADEVQFPATCIEAAVDKPLDRYDLLSALLVAFFEWREQLPAPAFLRAWKERLAFVGEQVQIIQPEQKSITGRLAGITPQGDLRLVLPDGTENYFSAGDVHLRRIGKNPVQ